MNSEQLAGWSTNRHIRNEIMARVDGEASMLCQFEQIRNVVAVEIWACCNQSRGAIWSSSYHDVRSQKVVRHAA